ncbi:NUDIX domain-containing protein [Buchnera aphidicola (Aphis craccivora)]|uniref:8-oxo-dGTP diphosphatase n=1 Tax=Buchnera aphidicola (Aphis craccivora) TaxID=466616 RepID=A0A4D6XLD8_9GAMM|nr:NUDIX domain-containing protein [Buchnera aphidicola]QCI16459.1 NUDIX domain-containing protein [Buchnera aphidicola (Aphis craccivora)]WAI17968.1 MAG: NUDIX domain-containing protein [Buchnera aphidicola (Aphis craccivora)]
MSYTKVAIGIILKKNKVYITKSNEIKYNANIWEFPGGKVKENENIIYALKRELLEEVGIIILKFNFFQYKKIFFKKLKLYFFLIKKWKGQAHSKEGYKYSWIFFKKLKFCKFPVFNFIVIKKLKNIY